MSHVLVCASQCSSLTTLAMCKNDPTESQHPGNLGETATDATGPLDDLLGLGLQHLSFVFFGVVLLAIVLIRAFFGNRVLELLRLFL